MGRYDARGRGYSCEQETGLRSCCKVLYYMCSLESTISFFCRSRIPRLNRCCVGGKEVDSSQCSLGVGSHLRANKWIYVPPAVEMRVW